ncbi:MAG: Methylthioribose kinase [Alphaproteobacteria bacterium MarineAlpha9_Bin4]|nr:hypothetical protein [Pelagibacterales bacterium]PPR25398.1 MAG: Methylthioribose kinase [Alphaproteobacteria bacterium MarineAlpha9_Bin4]
MKTNKLPKEIYLASVGFGLLSDNQKYKSKKITDGVSSDIWYVKTSNNEYCIKRALPKLTVKEDWFAPVDRNNFEAKYFRNCKKIVPQSFPTLLGHDKKKFILAMEWFNNNKFVVWKKKLLKKSISIKDGKRVGSLLGTIHSYYYKKKKFEKIFTNDKTFYDIRIEPYLIFTSKLYPELRSQYKRILKFLTQNKTTVIHGDFSPKNILIGKNYPIILDAETACWGNPIFDVAFFNNHIILKSILNRTIRKSYLKLSKEFIESYLAQFPIINNKNNLEKFIILQALLILARVDGKSPVEYLKSKNKVLARNLAKKILSQKIYSLNNLFQIWENAIKS